MPRASCSTPTTSRTVDIGITELWRAAFGSYGVMLERGVDVVVAEAHLRFRGSARFDDELTLEVVFTHLGNTSIVTRHRMLRDEELLVEVEIRHVLVSTETMTKTADPGLAARRRRPVDRGSGASRES